MVSFLPTFVLLAFCLHHPKLPVWTICIMKMEGSTLGTSISPVVFVTVVPGLLLFSVSSSFVEKIWESVRQRRQCGCERTLRSSLAKRGCHHSSHHHIFGKLHVSIRKKCTWELNESERDAAAWLFGGELTPFANMVEILYIFGLDQSADAIT